MIVVDTSALIAIIYKERESTEILRVLTAAQSRYISAVTLYEAEIVTTTRHGSAVARMIEDVAGLLEFEVVPFNRNQIRLASEAYRRYGKGMHPQAKLNLGDCASYALAKWLDLPLLFKGNDFTHTDIAPALPIS